MKKIVFYLIGGLLLMGCQKNEVDLIFDKQPEERMSERLTELRTVLLSSPNGWNGSLLTLGKGAYGFYFDFKDNYNVEMLADINNTTGSVLSPSTYRAIWSMNASLVFDTYNYITYPQEPAPTHGGTAGSGFMSDIEFEFVRANEDSVIFVGKKYYAPLLLTKASGEEKEAYKSGVMNTYKADLEAYFANKFNNYIEVPGISNKIEVSFNTKEKMATFQYIDGDGLVKSVTSAFNFDAKGLTLWMGEELNGVTLSKGTISNGTITLHDKEGKNYVVKQNGSPILPIENVYGYNKVYKTIGISTASLPAVNIESEFTNVWNTVVNNFVSSGRTARYFEFKFEGAKSIVFNLYYAAGTTNYTASVTFNYVIENGVMTLSNPTGHTSGNWNTRRAQIQPLETFLLNLGPVKIDWVPNNAGLVIGGLYSVDNPKKVLYGQLK